MPRTARASVGGFCYHVTGRGNGRATVFHGEADYRCFTELLSRGDQRLPIRILAYCLMPNHYHLVLHPHADGDLGRWLHWVLTSHVQRYRARHGGSGRIWQGRFHASIVQRDDHLLRVIRYVERNPLRALLVEHAESWPWSSLPERVRKTPTRLLSEPPYPIPDDWLSTVHQPLTEEELEAIRICTRRQRPYGDPLFTRGMAERLALQSTIAPKGRPPSRVPGSPRRRQA